MGSGDSHCCNTIPDRGAWWRWARGVRWRGRNNSVGRPPPRCRAPR